MDTKIEKYRPEHHNFKGHHILEYQKFTKHIYITYPITTMRTFSAISAVFAAALCVFSADASTLVRVRTQTQHKSLSRVRDARDGAFLDFEPAVRRLELSMASISMPESIESLSMPGDKEEEAYTIPDTVPDVVTVDFDGEVKSG